MQLHEDVTAQARFETEPELAVDAAVGLDRVAAVVQQTRPYLPVTGIGVLAVQPGDHRRQRGDREHTEDDEGGYDAGSVALEPHPHQLTRREAYERVVGAFLAAPPAGQTGVVGTWGL